jgi:thioredoxin-dependent peroxiredoxin
MIEGDTAPDFTLLDHTGEPQTLSALLSRGPVVLFFFPLASSPICTAQACHFRDLGSKFSEVGAQRLGISTDTVDRQSHFALQRSFDYPLLSDSEGVVSELFGVRRGRLVKLRKTVVARKSARRTRHTRRRGLLARLLPVRRATFVIGTDRTILKVVSSELRASVHADQALSFLHDYTAAPSSRPDADGDAHQSKGNEESIVDMFAEPAAVKPSLVRPYMLTAGRTDSGLELPLETPIEAVKTTPQPKQWSKHDVRSQILTYCAHSPSIAEVAAQVSLPLGATRFLVGELVTAGYLRVPARPFSTRTIDERRDLMERTLRGLRAL